MAQFETASSTGAVSWAQRLSQVLQLKRTWIGADTISFPAYIMKSNAEHIIPTTPSILEEISRLQEVLSGAKETQLLPNSTSYIWGDKPLPSTSTPMRTFRTALTNVPHFTLHDLRRTFSTKMAEWQVAPIDVVEAILDHTAGSRTPVQRVYDRHRRLPQMRHALTKYEARLLAVVGHHD